MTETLLHEIWNKTNGHCHFCGDPVSFRKRGYRRQRADGCWEVDHVIQRDKKGPSSIDNYLPACTSCNRLRRHRTGSQLRQLLMIGMIAQREIDNLTETGKKLIALRHSQTQVNKRRRGVTAVGKSSIDPILRAQIRREERDILIAFLRKNLERNFSAAELSKNTGVPKLRVRQLLDTSEKISVIGHGGRFAFQSRAPKLKRKF
jgi:hypothetical protein